MSIAQLLLAGGNSPATVTFTDSSVDATDATIYTFSAQSLGTAAGNRKTVVAAYGSIGSTSVLALVVNGVSASLAASAAFSTGTIELWEAAVPTGTSGDIVVTWLGAQSRCGIGVWAVYGGNATPFDTAVDISGGDPMGLQINVDTGGVLIAAAFNSNGSTFTWGGIDEDYDEAVEGANTQTGASRAFTNFAFNHSVSCNPSSSSDQALVAASW